MLPNIRKSNWIYIPLIYSAPQWVPLLSTIGCHQLTSCGLWRWDGACFCSHKQNIWHISMIRTKTNFWIWFWYLNMMFKLKYVKMGCNMWYILCNYVYRWCELNDSVFRCVCQKWKIELVSSQFYEFSWRVSKWIPLSATKRYLKFRELKITFSKASAQGPCLFQGVE